MIIIVLTINFQKKIDQIIDKTILWVIPKTVLPNHFTYLRMLLVPVIFILLEKNLLDIALPTFIFAASTDFIDGALARTRDQITDLGKIIDPIADKMLILTVLIYIGFEYFVVKVFVVVILFEVVGNLVQALFAKYLGRPIPANVFGKIKMIFQSICVVMFLIGVIINNQLVLYISDYLLVIALVFAVISSAVQIGKAAMRQFKRVKQQKIEA